VHDRPAEVGLQTLDHLGEEGRDRISGLSHGFDFQRLSRRLEQTRYCRSKSANSFGRLVLDRAFLMILRRFIASLWHLGTLAAIALFGVQGICNLLDLLDLFSEHLLLGFHRAQTSVNAAGQAVELLFCGPPFFSSKFRWIESRTSPKASAIRKPGG
jgi:hypothetical protein